MAASAAPTLIISNLISCTRIRIYVLYSMSLFDGPDGFRLDLTWYYERQSLLHNLYNISDLHKRSKRSPVLRRRSLTSNINPLTFHIVRSRGPSMVGPMQSLNGARLLLSYTNTRSVGYLCSYCSSVWWVRLALAAEMTKVKPKYWKQFTAVIVCFSCCFFDLSHFFSASCAFFSLL